MLQQMFYVQSEVIPTKQLETILTGQIDKEQPRASLDNKTKGFCGFV